MQQTIIKTDFLKRKIVTLNYVVEIYYLEETINKSFRKLVYVQFIQKLLENMVF